jgi:uncharacterized membrane protein YgcG
LSFFSALYKFGKNWKKIATMVGLKKIFKFCRLFIFSNLQVTTRNLTQIRSHAQKYFKKLERDQQKQSATQALTNHLADNEGVQSRSFEAGASSDSRVRSRANYEGIKTVSSEHHMNTRRNRQRMPDSVGSALAMPVQHQKEERSLKSEPKMDDGSQDQARERGAKSMNGIGEQSRNALVLPASNDFSHRYPDVSIEVTGAGGGGGGSGGGVFLGGGSGGEDSGGGGSGVPPPNVAPPPLPPPPPVSNGSGGGGGSSWLQNERVLEDQILSSLLAGSGGEGSPGDEGSPRSQAKTA